jgi:hypothetical protein
VKRFFHTLFLRNIQAGSLFEVFLLSAVASLLAIRTYLRITNYPQLGNGEFHIAHMLWGGLLMTLSLFILFGFLSNNFKRIAAVVGGIGFGAFIDELGKFITADNNYFYQPSIALIYVIFVIFFLLFRLLEQFTKYSSKEYAANALEVLEDVILLDLDENEKKHVRSLLNKADAKNPLVIAMKKLIIEVEAIESAPASPIRKLIEQLFKYYVRFLSNPRFLITFIVATLLHSSFEAITALTGFLSFDGFSYSGRLLSSTVSLALSFAATIFLLRNNRLPAFRMYKFSLLISILVTQFFLFLTEQLSAIVQLGASLFLLSIVQYFLNQEVRLRRAK